ncbi:unnamed protein product [Polarella glacialis]|uniref:FHA domain-containing protein n=1 Tax=Polarella glacialis TaxID=89957 RepID=A0A813EFP6_POLGL|nr:unnamed protein product [Polarella glacialis]
MGDRSGLLRVDEESDTATAVQLPLRGPSPLSTASEVTPMPGPEAEDSRPACDPGMLSRHSLSLSSPLSSVDLLTPSSARDLSCPSGYVASSGGSDAEGDVISPVSCVLVNGRLQPPSAAAAVANSARPAETGRGESNNNKNKNNNNNNNNTDSHMGHDALPDTDEVSLKGPSDEGNLGFIEHSFGGPLALIPAETGRSEAESTVSHMEHDAISDTGEVSRLRPNEEGNPLDEHRGATPFAFEQLPAFGCPGSESWQACAAGPEGPTACLAAGSIPKTSSLDLPGSELGGAREANLGFIEHSFGGPLALRPAETGRSEAELAISHMEHDAISDTGEVSRLRPSEEGKPLDEHCRATNFTVEQLPAFGRPGSESLQACAAGPEGPTAWLAVGSMPKTSSLDLPGSELVGAREANLGFIEHSFGGPLALGGVGHEPAFSSAGQGTGGRQVTLDCARAPATTDISTMPLEVRRLILPPGNGPWVIGRQCQPQFFARLVPDEAARNCISRNHFELFWSGGQLLLRMLSGNKVLLDGKPIVQQHPNSAVAMPPLVAAAQSSQGSASVVGLTTIQHGSEIGLCLPNSEEPFLLLQVLLRDDMLPGFTGGPLNQADQQGDQPDQQESVTEPAADTPEFVLACSKLRGRSLLEFAPEQRQLTVQFKDGQLLVGRQQQADFFEGLLGKDSPLISYISRAHCELRATGLDILEATNLSSNPLLVGDRELARGDKAVSNLPCEIGFLASFATDDDEDVPAPEVFLQLRLEVSGSSGSFGARGNTFVAVKASSGPRTAASPVTARRHTLSSEVECPAANEIYVLELGGSATQPSVPPERRQLLLSATRGGFTVGRSHQAELHAEVLTDGSFQWVSREHFRLDISSDGGPFLLTALSSNPLWRQRGVERTKACKGSAPLPLLVGDTVLLYTGAPDGSPDGPGCQGFLYWSLLALKAKAAASAVSPSSSAVPILGDRRPTLAMASLPTAGQPNCATSQSHSHSSPVSSVVGRVATTAASAAVAQNSQAAYIVQNGWASTRPPSPTRAVSISIAGGAGTSNAYPHIPTRTGFATAAVPGISSFGQSSVIPQVPAMSSAQMATQPQGVVLSPVGVWPQTAISPMASVASAAFSSPRVSPRVTVSPSVIVSNQGAVSPRTSVCQEHQFPH